MAKQDRKPTATQSAIVLASTDLACFSAISWPRLELAHHHRQIIERLEAVERGEIKRLMLALPPRHGKPSSGIALLIFPIRRVDQLPHHLQRESQRRAFLAGDFKLRRGIAPILAVHPRQPPLQIHRLYLDLGSDSGVCASMAYFRCKSRIHVGHFPLVGILPTADPLSIYDVGEPAGLCRSVAAGTRKNTGTDALTEFRR
jgi:hypothetical protein